MKKLFLFSMMCLMTLTMQAQSRKMRSLQAQSRKMRSELFINKMAPLARHARQVLEEWYVDLGLPSGTKWGSKNESEHYRYADAVTKYGKNLPSKSQWEELRRTCTWTWVEKENGYKVVGPNGNSIFLPCAGFRNAYDWELNSLGYGQYWSSTPNGTDYACCFSFWAGKVEGLDYFDKRRGLSVRLVLNR